MDESTGALAAPFNPPPSPLDLVPLIRWAFRGEANPHGERQVDVLWHAEVGGRFESRISIVEVVETGRGWAVYGDLDEASHILLAGDLRLDADGGKTRYRIDEFDMAIERCRFAVDEKEAA